MTDVELFSEGVVAYGLGERFNRSRLTADQWAKGYAEWDGLAKHLFSDAKLYVPRLPNIHFDFIYNPIPNASAFKYKGRFFIGITTGLRYMLDLILLRMLAHPRLFLTIGNPSEENPNQEPFPFYTTDAQVMAKSGIKAQRPINIDRLAYSHELFLKAAFFILGHELAHISRGHLDYLESKSDQALISESSIVPRWDLPADENLLESQLLEFDADRRSMLSSIETAKRIHETSSFVHPVPSINARRTVEHLLFDWSVAMNTFLVHQALQWVKNSVRMGRNCGDSLPCETSMSSHNCWR